MQTASMPHRGARRYFLRAPFDTVGPSDLVAMLDRNAPSTRFRYVVTPNIDHVVRLRQTIPLITPYEAAWLSICDSKPIAALAHFLGDAIPHMPGATLTGILFRDVIRAGDRIALVVADADLAAQMRDAYPAIDFAILVAPPDVRGDPARLQLCIDFVARSRARFTFIGIGSPQSEQIAFHASLDPGATGIGLCVGAALEFLVGRKQRAPLWMQRAGIEWAHRLASEPRRLWRRYVLRVLPFAQLVLVELAGRTTPRRSPPARIAGG